MQAEAASLLCAHRSPPGALRVLSRREDSETLIVHGEERAVGEGERLAWIGWFDSAEIAREMSHHCSDLLIAANMRPDRDGWHAFAVIHLPTLIQVAKNHLNIPSFPAALPKVSVERQAWTGKRIARLATMASEGYTAKAIADDPTIRSTPAAVYRAAHRFGIWLSEKSRGQVSIRLPLSALAFYERMAGPQGVTRDACIQRVLIAKAEGRPAHGFTHGLNSTSVRGRVVETT